MPEKTTAAAATAAPPSNRQRLQDAFQSDFKLSALVDLASLLGSDSFECGAPDEIEEFVEFALDKFREHPSVVPVSDLIRLHEEDLGMAADAIRYRGWTGLLVQFVTPVRQYLSANSWQSSWGYTASTWVYAESFDAAWQLGKAWAEEKHGADFSKWTASGKGASQGAAHEG